MYHQTVEPGTVPRTESLAIHERHPVLPSAKIQQQNRLARFLRETRHQIGRQQRFPRAGHGAVQRDDRAPLGAMLFFAELLDAMAHPLHEANGDAWIAIDDGVEAVARDFEEDGIVECPDAGPLRFPTQQRHLAEAITVAIRGEDAFAPALEPCVSL